MAAVAVASLLSSALVVGGSEQASAAAAPPIVAASSVVKTSATPPADADRDGLPDSEETTLGTDPNDSDSDDDGLGDWREITPDQYMDWVTDPLEVDTDGDGWLDAEEEALVHDPTNAGQFPSGYDRGDTDGDGYSDMLESFTGFDTEDPNSNPAAGNPLADLDGDWLFDAWEQRGRYNGYILDGTNADTDGDGWDDGEELWEHSTDPTDKNSYPGGPQTVTGPPDRDGDGLGDHREARLALDPTNPDSDRDGLADGVEVLDLGTDAGDRDTDDDGSMDSDEVAAGTDPTDGSDTPTAGTDTDGDLFTDAAEGYTGYDINDADSNPAWGGRLLDSDGDGLYDHAERKGTSGYVTSPAKWDTDGDGSSDSEELAFGSDPTDTYSWPDIPVEPYDGPDDDWDGLDDVDEVALGTNPNDWDTDNDTYNDGFEVNIENTDPLVADMDHDGVLDGLEGMDSPKSGGTTRYTDADSDDDGHSDGAERNLGTNPNDPSDVPASDPDTDGDGHSDAEEAFGGTDPNDPTEHA